MPIPSLSGSYIDQTYQRLVQTQGGEFADGLGNSITFGTINTGSFVTTSSFNNFTASYNTGSFSGSFTGDLNGTASVAFTALSAPLTPPGGNNKEVQFNLNGAFGGDNTLVFTHDTARSLQQGNGIQAFGNYSHAEGYNTITYGETSHAEGKETIAGWLGYGALQKSTPTIALDVNYGDLTGIFPPGTIVLFDDSIDSNIYSTIKAEVSESIYLPGANTEITLTDNTIFTGGGCIIGIYGNPNPSGADTQRGNYSHTEGSGSQTYGVSSHAQGLGTITLSSYQQVQGQYNIATNGQSAFIIGNGVDSSNRSNLLFASGSEIQITGSVNISGSLNITDTTNIRPYKIYTALLTQTGVSNPPTAVVLQDDFNNDFTFAYIGVGVYGLNSTSNLFTANKTFVLLGNTFINNPGEIANFQILSTSTIRLCTSYNTGNLDDLLVDTPIEIRIYP